MPTGSRGGRFDADEDIWLGMQFQGGVATFDEKTEKFQPWRLPPELPGDHVRLHEVRRAHHNLDGTVGCAVIACCASTRRPVQSRNTYFHGARISGGFSWITRRCR